MLNFDKEKKTKLLQAQKESCDKSYEKILVLEVKLAQQIDNLEKRLDEVYQRMFIDNGHDSVVCSVNTQRGDIQENRDSIINLKEEVKEKFDHIDKKLDKIDQSIQEATVFSVFHIFETFFQFGKTNRGQILKFFLIIMLGWISSPYIGSGINLVKEMIHEILIKQE